MTRLIADRPADRPGGDPPTAETAASPEVSLSTAPDQSTAAAGVVPTLPDGCQRMAPGGPALTGAQVSELVVTNPTTTSPAEVVGIDAHEARLAHAARESSLALPAADAVAAVEAGMLTDAVDSVISGALNPTTGDEEHLATPGDGVGTGRP